MAQTSYPPPAIDTRVQGAILPPEISWALLSLIAHAVLHIVVPFIMEF